MSRLHNYTGTLLLFVALACATRASAQDAGLFWKYKSYDGAIALRIPGAIAGISSIFAGEREERMLLRQMRTTRILIFEEGSPITARDTDKFHRKAQLRKLEEIITIRSGKDRFQIMAKEKNGVLRKLVVFFSADAVTGLISVRGRFRIEDLNRLIRKAEEWTDEKPGKLPASVPVIRA
ncbi:MAG: hypothetical protein RJA20_2378 [Bacteroidota bacterium]|jgi:hypothetical protein